jgi:hypothetical protein
VVSERLVAVERKRFADERTQQARTAAAELRLEQIERKKGAMADKDAADAAKKNAAEATEAGRERIQQLRAEQAAAEKVRDAEAARTGAEQQALSGTFNPGGGKATIKQSSVPVILTPEEKDIVKLKSFEAEVASLTKVLDVNKAAFKAGEISHGTYIKTLARTTLEIGQAKSNIADLSKTMKVAAAVQDTERNSIGRAQALILQYTNAKKGLNLATVDGARLNESYNKAIQKSNDFILKNADAETVRTKGIGEYTKGIGKAFGALRTLANILPGIGISGLFLAGFEALKFLVEEMGLFNSKLFDYKAQQAAIADLNVKAAESAGKEAGSLKVLRAEIENTNIPMKDRLQAVKNLQEQYPAYFKNLTNEQLLTGNAAAAYDEAARAILRKAQAQAASAKIEELTTKRLELQLKLAQDAEQTNKKIKEAQTDATVSGGGTGGIGGNFGGVSKQAKQKAFAEDFELRKKSLFDERKLLDEQIDFYLKFAAVKENIEQPKEKKEKKSASIKESTKAQLDSDFEIYKIAQQRKIKLLEDGVNDESKTFDERIAILQEFSNESLKLTDAQTANDRSALEQQLAAQQANLKKAKGTERNNLLVEIENTNTKIKILDAKNFDDRLKIFDTNEKKFLEVEKSADDQEEALRRQNYEQALKDEERFNFDVSQELSARYEAKRQVIDDNEKKGFIDKKEANKQREKLDASYHLQSIRNEIAHARRVLEIRRNNGEDILAEEKRLAQLAKDAEAAAKAKDVEQTESELSKQFSLYKKYYDDISNVIFGFLEDSLKAEEYA